MKDPSQSLNFKEEKIYFRHASKKILTEYSHWLSFTVLIIVAAIINASFFRWSNINNLFVQASTTGIIALGMSMVISAGEIDISVGAQLAIISGLGITVLNYTNSIVVMLFFCLIFGLIIGTVNGFLVAKSRMPAMIVTLATQSICRSIINHLGQGGPFTVSNVRYDTFRQISAGYLSIGDIKIAYPMLIFIILALLFNVIMTSTKFGKHIYAVGSNATSAGLSGVNVSRIKLLVFSVNGLLCGFSAWLYSSRVMAVAAASAGNQFEMDAIGAVAIGGTSMTGGRGKIIGTFLGALMFKVINNILTMADVPTFLNGAIKGGIIILAVLLQNPMGRRK